MQTRLAKNGYVTYLRNPAQHTNRACTHAGWGPTQQASRYASQYYANQMPWVVTVRRDVAPQWAIEEADYAANASEALDLMAAEDRARYEAAIQSEQPPTAEELAAVR